MGKNESEADIERWTYKSAGKLKDLPVWGYHGSYAGGGYVITLPDTTEVGQCRKGLLALVQMRYYDYYSSVVGQGFMSFCFFNSLLSV